MYEYKCPNESKCRIKKHCHIIETEDKLPQEMAIIHKCPAEKKKIKIKIYPESYKK